LLKLIKFPAVALLRKVICAGATGAKFCTIPELFVMPTPLMVKLGCSVEIVNALAPGLNTMLLTSISPPPGAMSTPVRLEDANVAVSSGPLGTVLGIQFVGICQTLLAGLCLKVALPAKLLPTVESRSMRMAAAEGRKARAMERRGD